MQMVWYLLCTLSTPLPNKFRILRSSVFGYFLEEVNKLIPFQDSPQSNPTCLTKTSLSVRKSTLGAYLLPLSSQSTTAGRSRLCLNYISDRIIRLHL